ncbi:MAG: RNA polymerase sigma factor [Gemmatimonadota bacterium]|nr:RNA polymerase sigma factor [Gemmatimonadota bacterium]
MRQKRRELEQRLARHHDAAFGWALTCCGGEFAEAEDVLQEAYLRMLSGKARFEGRSGFRTFLFGVVRRIASERRRRAVRRRRLLGRFRPEPATAPMRGDEVVARGERTLRIQAALATLSDRQREVLHLVFYEDMTVDAAAGVLGISIGSARTHYARGKARLSDLLAGGDR